MKAKVALLRGLGRESGHWDAEFLELMKSNFDVALLDYPGCGPFYKESFPSSSADLLAYLNKQIEAPVFLVAVSLGGMVALQWAEKFPENFLGMVLINSSASDLSPFYKRLMPTAVLGLLKAASHGRAPQTAEQFIVELVSNNKSKHRTTIEQWTKIARQRPTQLKNVLRQLYMASRFKSPQAPLKMPLQILASKKDRLADPSCSESLAKKYNAPIAMHSTGGHDLMIDDPHWVAEQIQLFINRRATV